jgi:hypothetical protein
MLRASRYTSTNPLIVSTGEALSRTQAISYASRSADWPVSYNPINARRAFCIGSVAYGTAFARCPTIAEVCVWYRPPIRYTSSMSRPSRLTRRELSGYRSGKPSASRIVTPTYRLFALASRMSLPPGGVLLVTVGSTELSKKSGSRRASSWSSVS